MTQSISDAILAARVRSLPDLLAQARAAHEDARPERDVYAIQEELSAELSARGEPHRVLMPYRHPPHPCSGGEQKVGSIRVTVVNPDGGGGRGDRLDFWDSELHEVECHGGALTVGQRSFLLRLPPSAGEDSVE